MKRPVSNLALSLSAIVSLLLASAAVQASNPSALDIAPSSHSKSARPLAKSLPHPQYSSLEPSLQKAFLKALYQPAQAANDTVRFDNPTQRLDADLTQQGLALRTAAAAQPAVHLRLAGLDYNERHHTLPGAAPQIEGERVAFHRGNVTEWFANTPQGIEQGFTIARRPDAASSMSLLALRLNVSGELQPKLTSDGKAVRLTGSGQNLIYRDLSSWDASHHRLPSHMEVSDHEIMLVVDDRQASYPITVDPMLQQQEIIAADSHAADQFGWSVAIKGDTAVIGTPGADNAVGAAYVFTRSAGSWTQLAKLTPSESQSTAFGYSVAITDSTIAVGAPTQNSSVVGTVYTYTRNGNTLTPQLPIDGSRPGGEFGYSVAVDENSLIICALKGQTSNFGAVYFYSKLGGGWSYSSVVGAVSSPILALSNGILAVSYPGFYVDVFQWTGSGPYGGYDFLANLDETAINSLDDNFGASVAVDASASSIAVGAPGTSGGTGAVFLFPIVNGGGATVYPYAQISPADAVGADGFGSSVAEQNGELAVGSPYHDDGSGQHPGAVYTYVSSNLNWTLQAETFAQSSIPGSVHMFGSSVAFDANTVIGGAPGSDGFTGAAYVFLFLAPPSALNDAYSTSPGTTLSVGAANGILANDINHGTGTLTAQIITSTPHGQLFFNSDGSFDYTPNNGFLGADRFTYVAINDQGQSNIATAAIAVQGPTVLNVPNVIGNEGSSTTLKATLGQGTSFNAAHTVAGASLSFQVGGVQVGTAMTNAKGVASLSFTPPTPGTLLLTVVFNGNNSYAPSTGYGVIVARNKTAINFNPDYATVGQGAIPSGYLTRTFDGQPLVGLTVTLSLNGKKVGSSVSDSNGYIAFNVGTQLHAGTFNYQASFKGDNHNQASTGTATLTVTPADTATTVSNAAGAIGATVTLKAKVTEQVGLTGLVGVPVSFLINGNAVGTATTVKGGIASLAYTLPVGTPIGANALTAQFAGNSDYNASVSGTATLKVSSNTSITVANVSGSKGQSVTLSAKLLTSPGGVGISGETLSFSVDGKAAFTAVTDGNGNASKSYTIPRSAASGSHTIVVIHKGNASYGSAAGSGVLTVQ